MSDYIWKHYKISELIDSILSGASTGGEDAEVTKLDKGVITG
jgi:hypothetical protein